MENKAHILNMYFAEHKKQQEIAESLGVSQQYVSKIIKADDRYAVEKESRKIQHQQKRKETKAQYQKQHRQNKYDDIEYQVMLLKQRQNAIDMSGKTRFFNDTDYQTLGARPVRLKECQSLQEINNLEQVLEVVKENKIDNILVIPPTIDKGVVVNE